MSAGFYTLAAWHVRAGQEHEFLRIWREELAPAFLSFNPSAQGTLIQSLNDPQEFYSFGPWDSLAQMQAARSDPGAQAALAKLVALCDRTR